MLELFSNTDWLPLFQNVVVWTSLILLSIGLLQNLYYLTCVPNAWLELNRFSQRADDHALWDILRSDSVPGVTIIVPAYNEEATIKQSTLALLKTRYPDFNIIVVNDGSSDQTAQTMISSFGMEKTHIVRQTETIRHQPIRGIYKSDRYSNLIFIDKENGKKADAINTGLTCVRTPLFCVIDADSLLAPTALMKVVRPFIETSDNVIAVGGTVGIVNGSEVKDGQVTKFGLPQNFLARLQVVEYVRAFLLARLAASRKGSLAIISGAFGVFRRDIAIEVGGYDTTTVGEDMELVLKMHRHMLEKKEPYAVRYVPEPVCWTEAPEDLQFLSNQRTRWQRGALECLSRHRKMIFNPRYGRLGMVTLPLFILIDLIGPVAEILGYCLCLVLLLIGWLSLPYFLATIGLIFAFGVFISLMALVVEQDEIERLKSGKDIASVLLMACVENMGYRQLCSFWRIKGLFQYFRGMNHVWGRMERRGFNAKP